MNDVKVLWLLRLLLKASGKQGVSQGGVISPLLSNVYLNEVDKMLEKAKAATRQGRWMKVEYARFADDLVVLVDTHPRQAWLRKAVEKRVREELAKLQVEVNEEKVGLLSQNASVCLPKKEACTFLFQNWREPSFKPHESPGTSRLVNEAYRSFRDTHSWCSLFG